MYVCMYVFRECFCVVLVLILSRFKIWRENWERKYLLSLLVGWKFDAGWGREPEEPESLAGRKEGDSIDH